MRLRSIAGNLWSALIHTTRHESGGTTGDTARRSVASMGNSLCHGIGYHGPVIRLGITTTMGTDGVTRSVVGVIISRGDG